jgi:hypothetical protein
MAARVEVAIRYRSLLCLPISGLRGVGAEIPDGGVLAGEALMFARPQARRDKISMPTRVI